MLRRQLLVASGSLLLGACVGAAKGAPPTAPRPSGEFVANPRLDVWPAFISSAPAQVRQAYRFAAQHEAELRYVPCYCGCGASGHTSNADCFVKSRSAEGWMTLEPHGSHCGTCVGIALDVKGMLTYGMSVREIRSAIDAKWASAGPGTPTPLP